MVSRERAIQVREYKRANPDKVRKWNKTHWLKHGQRLTEKYRMLRVTALAEYGGKCACCGETTPAFLAFDHIDGKGADHRKKIYGGKSGGRSLLKWLKARGWPKDNFQLLCFNCNWAKGSDGVCPHESMRNLYEVPREGDA